MQNGNTLKLIFLIVLNIIVLVSVVVLSSLVHAQENQELHQKTLYEITKQTFSKPYPHIAAGNNPSAIDVDYETNVIYVANYDDDTVSVIDGKTNTKIRDDIKVGDGPRAIGVDYKTNVIYV